MKSIYINRKPIIGPWGGGNKFVVSLYELAKQNGLSIASDPFKDELNYIFLQSPKSDSECNFSIEHAVYLKNKQPKVKIILRVNDCDARKGTTDVDKMWIETSKYVDTTIFVSNWMKNYFIEKGWRCTNNHVVYNGVSLDHFKPREKINNGKINIVTHHWSNNRMKGFDFYEALDKFVGENSKFTFTYIGRELGTFRNTEVIAPIFGQALGDKLSRYDVYVSDSKWDPGPNHILESLACQIPTFVCTHGGGSVEFAGKDHVYDDLNSFINKVSNRTIKMNKKIQVGNWEKCIKSLVRIINDE